MKKRPVSLFAICVFVVSVAYGDVTGRISGVAMDSSGAVIPGVTVRAVDTLTGIQHTATTNGQGFYAFPALPVGNYSVHFEKSGFKTYQVTGLVINVNTVLRVDATLQIGVVTQAVTVSGTALHVETTSTQMGEVITGTHMVTLPLNGRTYTDLLALQPGVVPVNSGEYASPSPSGMGGAEEAGNLSISGQRENANGFMVNGGNVEEGSQNGTAIVPNLDSIAEFRIITNNFNAEYGNYSGGLVNVVTKSGTNQFHGDAFEFLRNTSLDARNFYAYNQTNPLTGAQIPGSAIGAFHQNQFGATVGGPILHNRVFFFVDYQGTRNVIGVNTGDIAVPSVAERNGDLSGVASQLTGTVNGAYWAGLLSQRLGYPVSAGEPYYAPGCTSSAQCVLPKAQVPQSAWASPVAHLMKYIPLPNIGSNYFSSSAYDSTLRDDKGSGRLDANTRLGMVSGYYFIDNYSSVNPYPTSNVPGFSGIGVGNAQQVEFSDTKSFGPSAVNVLRLNYMRDLSDADGDFPVGGVGPTLSSLGFVEGPGTLGIVPQAPAYEGVPNIAFNTFTIGENPYFGAQINNTYQVADDFTKVHATHTLKFGGETHLDQIDLFGHGARNGTFSFDGSETGVDFADFLIGAPLNYIQGSQLPMYTYTHYYGLYAQDGWRATRNLTANYGLRWEVSTPWVEKHNEIETMIPGVQSVVFPTAPKGWLVPGDPGVPRTVSPVRYNNFAPRLGLAYSPGAQGGIFHTIFGGPGRTSIRAGWGVFFTTYEDAGMFNASGDAPYGFFYVSPLPPLFATPFVDRATGDSEGQRFPVPFPPLNVSATHPDPNVNWAQYLPISSSPGFFHTNRLPYAEDYMFSFERQVGGNSVLSLSYVGTQGHRLLSGIESNPGNPALCLSVSQPSEVLPGKPTCGPNGENGVYYPVTGGIINGTRHPFGNDFGSNSWFASMANSNYNALEVTFHHTSGRAELLAGYTYSKALDNSSGWGGAGDFINPVNPKLDKALSSFDTAQNAVFSYSYEMPFDKLFHASNRLTRGWTVSGITHFSTGLPVFINYGSGDNSLLGTFSSGPTGTSVDEPDFTPGKILNNTNPRSGQPYFNTSLFSPEPIGKLGTANRRFFTGPGLNGWDLALLKNVTLTESKSLQFRAEFFNVFNHAQFNNPDGNFLDFGSTFGLITSAREPRIGQLALKFLF